MMSVRWIGLCLLLLQWTGCGSATGTAGATRTLDVTLAGERFTLELALTDEQRYRGLSDRDRIAPDGGMLFVFPDSARRTFVMRRCLVPIDIAYVAHNGVIVSMHEMTVEPYDTPEHKLRRYDSGWPARYAIELAGGTMRRLGLRVGQQVELPHDSLHAQVR